MNVKVFPSRHYSGILKKDYSFLASKLEKETQLDNQYVVDWSATTFNGLVHENSFDVTLSSTYYGKLCFFKGIVEDKGIHIEIQIKTIYKWILGFLFLYPLLGLLASFVLRGFDVSKELIFHSIMATLVFRISLEIVFIFISKKGLKHLIRILEISMLKRER
ncbi:hypothetical protein [uncultured Dokdonia sp.]|uniref:hypothetical protein n=1 Tax=uncultured Dokdonia sp. TaxID=575653 RepID=UPI0026281518|nr:hypothetical protein [uncultured Dokdonia sp.]